MVDADDLTFLSSLKAKLFIEGDVHRLLCLQVRNLPKLVKSLTEGHHHLGADALPLPPCIYRYRTYVPVRV